MKFSVIIPVFNGLEYIESCLNSVYENDYQDFEVICVDDGSKDSTYEWLAKNKEKYTNLNVFKISHVGVSGVRNYGLRLARGEYICWLDSDDCISKHYFKSIEKILKHSNSNCVQIDYTQRIDELHNKEEYSNNDLHTINKNIIITDILKSQASCYCWSFITKKEYYNGIEYPVGHTFEDINKTHKLLQNIEGNIIRYDRPLYFYRNNGTSIVNTIDSKKRMDIFLAWKERLVFSRENFPELYNDCYSKLLISFYLLMKSMDIEDNYNSDYMKMVREYISFSEIYFSKLTIEKK